VTHEQARLLAVAAIREGHGGKPCNCPRAYSMCKHAVMAQQSAGVCVNHGGWGWLGSKQGFQDGPAVTL
jgi:hypothetical protein